MNLTTLFSKFKSDNASMKLVQDRVFAGSFRSGPDSAVCAEQLCKAVETINAAVGSTWLVIDVDVVNSFGDVLSHDLNDLANLRSAACAEVYLRTA